MTYKDLDNVTWRSEQGIVGHSLYKRKWAFRPIICSDGTKVWLEPYYAYYTVWTSGLFHESDEYGHTDFNENITEAEYIVRKLSDNL